MKSTVQTPLKKHDQLRARFVPNDAVRFEYHREMVKGTLVRTNPKRAVVRVGDDEFNVPYELLFPMPGTGAKRLRRIESIQNQALGLMARHGLHGWRFKFDHSTRRAGCCSYYNRTISISFDLAGTGSDADIRDTILHEIAHALVGKRHNHDDVWKAMAKAIGCNGERTHQLEFAPPRWNVTCENRCWNQTAQQRNTRLICRTCGGRVVYSPYAATA
jgi:predicted SprT family Zn-dependent metalloprotease